MRKTGLEVSRFLIVLCYPFWAVFEPCRIIRLFTALPKTIEAQVVGKQFLRSGTSVGAHYREAARARSSKEFVAKIDLGLQELEETAYWLELLIGAEIISEKALSNLMQEVSDLTAILTTVSKNTKKEKL
jgi:four helix bundle protein